MNGLLTTIIYGTLVIFPKVFSTCPTRCNCKGTVLECSQTIPNFLPDNITKFVATDLLVTYLTSVMQVGSMCTT